MPETSTNEADAEVLPLVTRSTLRNLYRDFSYTFRSYVNPATRKIGFIRYMEKSLEDQGYRYRAPLRTEITACGRCSFYDFNRDMTSIGGRQRVCADCAQFYARCRHCDNMAPSSSFYPTSSTTYNVCINCVNSRFFYCSDCATYQPNTRVRSHRHVANQCCESQRKTFQVPNNGDGMLSNDRRAHIQLPAGEISDEGLEAIRRQVRDQQYYTEDRTAALSWSTLSQNLGQLGNMWQTKDGNFPKRLSRYAYKEHGLKVSPDLMTVIGNVARDHSAAVDHYIELTRDLNLPASEFVHNGSCWWSSYSNSRCALKTNGGFALRTYRGDSGGRPQGRAWVMPLKRSGTHGLTPTYNTEDPLAYMVFNGYGDLNGYTPARILSYMMGATYKKMGFTHSRMYINSGGYLVAPQDVIQSFVDNSGGTLELSGSVHSTLFDQESRELVNV